MELLVLLQIILLILVIAVILKLFFSSKIYEDILSSCMIKKNENSKIVDELRNARIEAANNINRVIEESFVSSKDNNSDTNFPSKDEYIVSYLNRPNRVKIELYYKPSCPHCIKFMPVWERIINDLPTDATYEEINCETNPSRATENKITSVPSIILLVDNERRTYMGSRTYEDIKRFLQNNGVNLIKRTFEDFKALGNTTTDNAITINPHCPAVTFDKEVDVTNDSYMYQIFNTNGQYGYATGGNNSDKLLTPFQAAYSTIDSYLSSLPDYKNPTKQTYKNVNECATLYSKNIVNFGLCDLDALNEIQKYKTNVSSGKSNAYIDGTDYSGNTIVVNAIKKACGFDE
jgi:thiol-disulfide isomerase/thioredoxin